MNREKSEFNILKKIEEERMKRNWSEYTLAKNSNLTQSTISTWYRRDLQPSVASIEKICSGLGITPVSYTHLDVYKRQVTGVWLYMESSF